ncbi:hypothetical protein PJL18_04223 [Paenarthrobacter nicotinovorans]|nr:hypothetical protein [Paenarthrobacter nicotinovorans]
MLGEALGGLTLLPTGKHRDGEAQQHPCHGGVDAGCVNEPPRRQGQRHQEVPAADPLLYQEREERQRDERGQQHERLEPSGVEEGNDADGDEVVHHGKRQQERPERGGKVRVDHSQDRQCEGNVRRRGNGPALEGFRGTEVEENKNQRRDCDAADCCSHRNNSPGWFAEFPGHEFAFELQSRQEEEHRQQSVGGPVAQAELKVPGFVAYLEVAECEVAVGCGGVCPDEGYHCCGQEKCSAHGFRTQDREDPAILRVAGAREDFAGGGFGRDGRQLGH